MIFFVFVFFFFMQKTAYDRRISDWSSDVCSSDLVHREYFAAAATTSAEDQSFEVELASSGQTFHIPPDKTVLEILAANGIDIPVSCEQGICGTCVTRVLRGEPDHRDLFMTDQEHAANDQFTPCCSRARSLRLVLDL